MASLARPTPGRPGSPSVRLATFDDDLHHLYTLINDAYKVGERGLVVDTPEQPFIRMREEDLRTLIQSESLLLLVSSSKHIIGCVKVDKHITEDSPYSSLHGTLKGRVGEWGGNDLHSQMSKKILRFPKKMLFSSKLPTDKKPNTS